MYTQVASKHVIAASDTIRQRSQAVSMNGGNAICVEISVFNQGSTDAVDVMPEVGSELQKWQDTSPVRITGVDYKTKQVTDFAAQYVRWKYFRGESPSQKAVVAAGINVANLQVDMGTIESPSGGAKPWIAGTNPRGQRGMTVPGGSSFPSTNMVIMLTVMCNRNQAGLDTRLKRPLSRSLKWADTDCGGVPTSERGVKIPHWYCRMAV